MPETTTADTSTDSTKSSSLIQYDDRAYGLLENIRSDLENYGLDPGQISIDLDIESSEDSIEIEYRVETLEWYEDDGELGLDKDPVSFTSFYSTKGDTEIPKDEIIDLLEDHLDGSAIRANGDIIQKSLSPDYDAF